jgi:hypothetical protein
MLNEQDTIQSPNSSLNRLRLISVIFLNDILIGGLSGLSVIYSNNDVIFKNSHNLLSQLKKLNSLLNENAPSSISGTRCTEYLYLDLSSK